MYWHHEIILIFSTFLDTTKILRVTNLTLASHLALSWPILRNGFFVRRNWIEISLWCFRKTTTQNRCRGRRRHRPRIRGCSWQMLWCYSVSDELDMAHSLRRALFSVARKTHCENISFRHTYCSSRRERKREPNAESILFRECRFEIETLLAVTFGFIVTSMSFD